MGYRNDKRYVLTNRAAVGVILSSVCLSVCLSVRLSVMLSIVAKRYILEHKCLNK